MLETVTILLKFVFAYCLLGLVGWSLVSFVYGLISEARVMHQIPCSKCIFFTGDYRLKCTVKPQIANTEKAIACGDYQSNC